MKVIGMSLVTSTRRYKMRIKNIDCRTSQWKGEDFMVTFDRLSGRDALRFNCTLENLHSLENSDAKIMGLYEMYLDILGNVIINITGFEDITWPASYEERKTLLDSCGYGFVIKLMDMYQTPSVLTEDTEKK